MLVPTVQILTQKAQGAAAIAVSHPSTYTRAAGGLLERSGGELSSATLIAAATKERFIPIWDTRQAAGQ